MQTYKLTLEYNGTAYSGWQVQKNATSIQGELLRAARQVVGPDVDVQGAGRTDAGVHALGQVAHLSTGERLSTQRLLHGLNDALPEDIHILELRPARLNFHARHDAIGRSYIYLLSQRRTAFGNRQSWWVRDSLNTGNMREAAARLIGEHDFAHFADKRIEDGKVTRCNLMELSLHQWGELMVFRVAGDHFLWKMVRRLVGILVEVGRGTLKPRDMIRLLAEPSELPARHTAPPFGLYLEQVWYPGAHLRPLPLPVFPLGRLHTPIKPAELLAALAPTPEQEPEATAVDESPAPAAASANRATKRQNARKA